jgi:hypothetical protein
MALWLLGEGYTEWGLVALAPGAAGLIFRWALAPPIVLFLVSAPLAMFSPYRMMRGFGAPAPRAEDLLLAASALLYLVSAYRHYSLARRAMPDDMRRREKPSDPRVKARWAVPGGRGARADRVEGSEVAWMLILVALVSLAAYVITFRIQAEAAPAELRFPEGRFSRNALDRVWRGCLVAWILAGGLAVGHAVLSVFGWLSAGKDEARLYLQDQLWSATRGEQRRIQRWMVWARLRRGGA